MSKVITGIFDTPNKAAQAVQTIEARGFTPGQISLVTSDGVDRDAFTIDSHSKLPEGAAIGAAGGGAVTALVAGLTAVGTVATGGAGVLAAGPLVAALAGAGAGAAGGGALGGLIGAAIPEHEVKHYEDAIGKGQVMIGVECDDKDRESTVKDTFKHFDAEHVSTA